MFTSHDALYLALLFGAVLLCLFPLTSLLFWALEAKLPRLDGWISRLTCSDLASQSASQWVKSLLGYHALAIVFLMALLMGQAHLPFNPQHLPGLPWDLALNTAVSFVTNTNWQAYSGESTLSHFSQMAGLGTQNFLSPAVGLAVMAALARAFRKREAGKMVTLQEVGLGNFWRDIARVVLLVLLPLASLLALLLVSQGVVQNLSPDLHVTSLLGTTQVLPMGPAATQVAIKQLGTNGGGFFGVNSLHPFENPTSFSNFLETWALLALAAACPLVYGRISCQPRHGKTLFGVMLLLLVLHLGASVAVENLGHPLFGGAPLLEGKDLRFGVTPSATWAALTTATSNGSVNAQMSSLSPLTGGIALFQMMLGEVIFGGLGSGVYGLVLFAILTVFVAGLMVGRSPEYLGRRMDASEVRWSIAGVLIPSVFILGGTCLSVLSEAFQQSLSHTGPHGFSEMLYAWTSTAGNNGSAFGGLNANTISWNVGLSVSLLGGRLGVIIPTIAVAGLALQKKQLPETAGSFPASGVVFGALLIGVTVILGALTFLPALALGPIVEHLQLFTP